MTSADLLIDAFGRIRDVVHQVVTGLSRDQLAYRIDPGANSVAWLVWHLSRVQDDHVAEVSGSPQVWTANGWTERFGLPFAPADTGFGHGPDDVAEVRPEGRLLTDYLDAVHEQTVRFVARLTDEDLTRVVDDRWDPPVTLGVRLVSVVSDDLQHAGQAAYIRGHLNRTAPVS